MTLAEAIVKQQPHLAGDPLLALLEANPEQTELLLPVLVLSTLQYNELKRMVPKQEGWVIPPPPEDRRGIRL